MTTTAAARIPNHVDDPGIGRCEAAECVEDARQAALRSLHVLETAPGEGFDRICEMASVLLEASSALIFLQDGERHWFKGSVGISPDDAAKALPFCRRAAASASVLASLRQDADAPLADAAEALQATGLRACAGAPLVLAPGVSIGSLCVFSREPRHFAEADLELLSELSKVVVSEVALHRATREALASQSALFSTEQRYRALLEASSSMVFRAGPDGRVVEVSLSGQFSTLLVEDYLGLSWVAMVHPDDRPSLWRQAQRSRRQARAWSGVHRVRAGDGAYRWTRIRVAPLLDESGVVREWIGNCADEHDRHVAEDELRRGEERLRLALTAARMVAWEFDPERNRTNRSDNSQAILGIDATDLDSYLANIHPEDRALFFEAYAPGGNMRIAELRYRHPDGRLMWLSSRGTEIRDGTGGRRIIGVTYDITDRKASEERAWRAANHDGLTGLPNRRFFQMRLDASLRAAAVEGSRCVLILLDIDDFKGVNDSVGHEAGDTILRETADRLRKAIGARGMIARLGSDEFGVLLVQNGPAEEVRTLAASLLEELRRDIAHGALVLTCRASAGIALFPEHHASAGELMKDAEMALYAAKTGGDSRALVYEPHMRDLAAMRLQIAREMRGALEAGEIAPFYQPKIDLRSGEIIGFEALARWRHPERGLLTPASFASAFESQELALGIGRTIVTHVMRDIRSWLDAGVDPGCVAVNLSPADFGDSGVATGILGLLAEAGVPTRHFSVEVTESVFLGNDGGKVGAALRVLHEAGVRIALDDFGTGFASLTHLKRFPVDEIKIDRSFVRDIENDADDAAIVSAVIGLGRSLSIDVIAEGVETLSQARFLRDNDCGQAQGFLFGKPMAASRIPGCIRQQEQAMKPCLQRATA